MIREARRPQLDALRCLAVLGVLVTHVWQPGTLPGILGPLDVGHIGVELFFVLSGFLITSILLECRDRAAASGVTPWFFVKRFYARRFLRIFPLYYLALVLLFVINFEHVRALAPWLFTYTWNLYQAFQGQWIGNVVHFWTLAVEEQFYLLWPWLILFLPRRLLVPSVLALICMGPLSRAAILLLDPTASPDTQWVRATITFGSWDSLGAGALLALLARQTSGGMLELRSQLKPALAVGMVAGLAVLAADFYLFHWAAWFVLGDLVMTVPLAWLVVGGATGFGGVGGRVLRWRPLLFIGLISYGVYLLHPFALVFLERLAKLLGIGFPASGIEAFALTTALSVFVAALSWRFFEAPINRMKRHLPYETASMVRGSAREQTSENAAAPDRTGG